MPDLEPRPHYVWRNSFSYRDAPVYGSLWWWTKPSFPRHDHDFFEINLHLEGEATHLCTLGEHALQRGDVFVFRPGAWHAYPDVRYVRGGLCCFAPELLRRELAWSIEDPGLNWLLWHGPVSDRHGIAHFRLPEEAVLRCESILDRLGSASTLTGPEARALRIGCVTLLLAEMIRPQNQSHPESKTGRPAVHPAVMRAIHLLEDALDDAWTVDALSDRLDIDASHLSRVFREATGLPPMAYLARSRAERAAMLLIRTQLSMGEIASAVGWEDPNYFSRRFRSHFGVTPSQYRAQFPQHTALPDKSPDGEPSKAGRASRK